MHERDHDRRREPGPLAQPRPSVNAVLELQRTIGNRGTTQVLARDTDKNRPNFEHSVKFGKFGPIEITGGNIGDWAAKKTPDDLKVISAKGKHSDELKRLFESKARIDTVETTSVVGENSLVTIHLPGREPADARYRGAAPIGVTGSPRWSSRARRRGTPRPASAGARGRPSRSTRGRTPPGSPTS